MRDFAQIRLSIWNDDAFLDLTPAAQHLYFVLLTNPALSYCGTADWHPGRIAARAKGWDKDQVYAAAAELVDGLYIVVDADTDEYLVRSFVRNDSLMRQHRLPVSMARARADVTSRGIRAVIVDELKRLHADEPKLKAWESPEVAALLEGSAIAARDFPCGDGTALTAVYGKGYAMGYGIGYGIGYGMAYAEGYGKGYADTYAETSGKGYADPYNSNSNSNLQQEQRQRADADESGTEPAEPHQAETMPSPTTPDEALDRLAAAHAQRPAGGTPDQWSTPEDPRCREHAHLPADQVPACHHCAQARRWFQARADATKEARREAITACPWCDDRGMLNGHHNDGTAWSMKCTHPHDMPHPPEPPTKPEPQGVPDTAAQFLAHLEARTTGGPF